MNNPKKQTNRLIFVLIPAIVCLLAVQPVQASEPVYNGKPLSDWLLLNVTRDASATEAIRQIGTNAIPTLLDILGAKEWNKKRVVSKLKSEELKKGFFGQQAAAEDIRYIAVDGFAILGTNAESAVPQLAKLLHDPETCSEAARVLTQVGPKGFSVLTNAINDEDLVGVVVLALGQKGGGDPQVITRLLLSALKSSNPTTRGNAAGFLGGKDATLAVPALIPMLDDSDPYPRRFAVISLGSYGPAAKSAAPKLFSIYTNHPDVFIMGALKGIDMEAAAKAEVFLVNSGPLNGARSGYTRTSLPNGKELIAGGYIHTEIPTVNNHHLSSAELYEPATGKWTETSEMSVTRDGHTATLLHNGKVLVSGGYDAKNNALSSAELYDPTTGKWTETGSMNDTHPNGLAALQSDGKVRISGSWNGRKIPNDELYDPATGIWTVITKK